MRQWQTANDVDEIAAAERRELKRQKRLAKQQAEVEMLKATVDKAG